MSRLLKSNNPLKTLCVTLAGIVLLSGCSSVASDENNSNVSINEQVPTERIVTDMKGDQVTIPDQLDEIAITHMGGVVQMIATLDSLDHVVATASTQNSQWFRKIYPALIDLPDYGAFEEVNTEEMLKLAPDIIFAPGASPDVNKKMKELGLPVYVTKVEDTYDYLKAEWRAIAKLVDKEQKVEDLIAHWEDKNQLVHERVKDIPEDQRKKVYIMRGDILQTHNKKWSSSDTVIAAGGINVGAEAGPGFDVNVEDILGWDPDFIFQVIRKPNNVEYYESLKKDSQFKELKAIKEDKVFPFPMGMYYWYQGYPETGLAVLWMGKTLYPELFEDIDMEEETKSFYKQFYNLDISQEDYELLFANFNYIN